MTKKTKTVWTTDSGEEFASESECQAAEINDLDGIDLIKNTALSDSTGTWIVRHKDAILSILGAKRRTRSDKGKSRKAKEVKVAA